MECLPINILYYLKIFRHFYWKFLEEFHPTLVRSYKILFSFKKQIIFPLKVIIIFMFNFYLFLLPKCQCWLDSAWGVYNKIGRMWRFCLGCLFFQAHYAVEPTILLELVGKEVHGDMFALERASVLYNICCFYLKRYIYDDSKYV